MFTKNELEILQNLKSNLGVETKDTKSSSLMRDILNSKIMDNNGNLIATKEDIKQLYAIGIHIEAYMYERDADENKNKYRIYALCNVNGSEGVGVILYNNIPKHVLTEDLNFKGDYK